MNLPLNKCIPAERFISIDAVEEAVLTLSLGERMAPVEYQALGAGFFLITRGCSHCAGAVLAGMESVDGVRTRSPRTRVKHFLRKELIGRRAFLSLPVEETLQSRPLPPPFV